MNMEFDVKTKTGKHKKITLPAGAYPLQFGGIED